MKKLFLTLIAAGMFFMAKADDTQIDYKSVPQKAKDFITKYFANVPVVSATIDKEIIDTEYTVYLSNGSKVNFKGDGNWKETDCGVSTIPAGIVPEKIVAYVAKNYAGIQIVKINLNSNGYDIKLSNSLNLKFTLKFDFIRVN